MGWNWKPTGRAQGRQTDGQPYERDEETWVWKPVRVDKAGQLYRGRGGILREETYDCAFCRGTGEKPRGSKCPVCKGKKTVSVTPPAVVCAYCKGRGEERPRTNITCTACRGKGVVPIQEPIEPCPHCRGTGAEPTNKLPCAVCRGKGVVTVKKKSPRQVGREAKFSQNILSGDSSSDAKEPKEVTMLPGGSERDVLEITQELGEASRTVIADRMGISSAYAEHICSSLFKGGYLSKTSRGVFALTLGAKRALEKKGETV